MIKKGCYVEKDVVTRIEKGMLNWSSHVKRTDELARLHLLCKSYKANVSAQVGKS